ncbi:MAG: hypothetical protein AB1445_09995 [Bacillota bacterium]
MDLSLPRVRELMTIIAKSKKDWIGATHPAVARVVGPALLKDIWVYPVFGYDLGIGHLGTVCMNLNARPYLESHVDLLYCMMHDVFHVAYERIHTVPELQVSSQGLRDQCGLGAA